MNQTDIDRIKAYCAKATTGPWRLRNNDHRQNIGVAMAEEVVSDYSKKNPLVTLHATAWKPERWGNAKPNAEFIVNARTDLPAAIAEIERLQKSVGTITKGSFDGMQALAKDNAALRAELELERNSNRQALHEATSKLQ